MRSLILIVIPYIILYKFLVKNLCKIRETVNINEIPNSNYNSLQLIFQIYKTQPQNWILTGRSFGRLFKISGVLVTICIGAF